LLNVIVPIPPAVLTAGNGELMGKLFLISLKNVSISFFHVSSKELQFFKFNLEGIIGVNILTGDINETLPPNGNIKEVS
jgi:hypothetical protein